MFILGILYPRIYYSVVYDEHLTYYELETHIPVDGEVTSVTDYQHSVKVSIKPSNINNRTIPLYKKLIINLYIPKKRLHGKAITLGSYITTQSKLKPIRPTLNKGLFDWRLYNFYHGIKYRGSVGSKAQLEISHNKQPVILQRLSQSKYLWLYQGVLLGDTSQMPVAFQEQIRKLGISHLFAVSGLHMGIVFGLSYFVCKPMFSMISLLNVSVAKLLPYERLRLLNCVCALSFCFVYLHFAQYATSAIRAFIMVSIVSFCLISAKRYSSYRSLWLAFILVLLINPFVMTTVGFYFSFVAVLSILCAIYLIKRLAISQKLAQLVLVQICITVMMLPIGGYFFNGVSQFSLFINLIAIPLFSVVVMPLLLFSFILACGFGFPHHISLLDSLLALIVDLVMYLDVSASWFYLPTITWQFALFFVTSLLIATVYARSLMLTVPLCAIYLLSNSPDTNKLTINVLDVGHGLSVLISKDKRAVLYDLGARFGSFSYFNSVVHPTIKLKGLELTTTIISHDDNDHSGGLEDLTKNGYAHTITAFGSPCDFQEYYLDGVLFTSIPLHGTYASKNSNSCVVLVTYGEFSLLLTGDIEKAREQSIIEHNRFPPIDVMLSPHHGSDSSSGEGFIDALNPTWVIHSVNAYNRWKLPDIRVTSRYATSGVKQMATNNGGIEIVVGRHNYTIEQPAMGNQPWFLVE